MKYINGKIEKYIINSLLLWIEESNLFGFFFNTIQNKTRELA